MEVKDEISYVQLSIILDTLSYKYKEGYIEFPFTLNEKVEFRKIINDPCSNRKSLLTALKDSNKTNVYKRIALYGLQHLCIDDYMEVLKTVFFEYKDGKVDENFLMAAVNQDGFSLELYKNYKNEQLQQLLKQIAVTVRSDENKIMLSNVMSGSSWQDLKDYYKESGNSIPWICK